MLGHKLDTLAEVTVPEGDLYIFRVKASKRYWTKIWNPSFYSERFCLCLFQILRQRVDLKRRGFSKSTISTIQMLHVQQYTIIYVHMKNTECLLLAKCVNISWSVTNELRFPSLPDPLWPDHFRLDLDPDLRPLPRDPRRFPKVLPTPPGLFRLPSANTCKIEAICINLVHTIFNTVHGILRKEEIRLSS